MTSIPLRQRRRDNNDFIYVTKTGDREHDPLKRRYRCPSCLEHFATIEELNVHAGSHITIRQALQSSEKVNKNINISASNGALSFPPITVMQQLNEAIIPIEIVHALLPVININEELERPILGYLKSMKSVHSFVLEALNEPYTNLSKFLWRHDTSEDNNDDLF